MAKGCAIVAVVIVGVFLLFAVFGGGSGNGGGVPTGGRAVERQTTHRVSYEATGGRGHLTYENANGSTEQKDSVQLPWSLDFNADSGQFVYLSVQNEREYGSVSCRIRVDGVTVKQATSDGAYVIASCSGSVP